VEGSKDLRCDQKTGKCSCKDNYAGHRCDECVLTAHRFPGNLCEICGKCTKDLLKSITDSDSLAESRGWLNASTVHEPWWKILGTVEDRFEGLETKAFNLNVTISKPGYYAIHNAERQANFDSISSTFEAIWDNVVSTFGDDLMRLKNWTNAVIEQVCSPQ
jgi:hypothetical protein